MFKIFFTVLFLLFSFTRVISHSLNPSHGKRFIVWKGCGWAHWISLRCTTGWVHSLYSFGKLYRITGLDERGAIHPFLTLFIYSLTGSTLFFFSKRYRHAFGLLGLLFIHVKKTWKYQMAMSDEILGKKERQDDTQLILFSPPLNHHRKDGHLEFIREKERS